jgi:hypothetical protein
MTPLASIREGIANPVKHYLIRSLLVACGATNLLSTGAFIADA